MPEINSTLEQEITQLEQQLSEKKASFGKEETETKETEKEILHTVVGEKIQEHLSAPDRAGGQAGAPQYQPAPAKPAQGDDETPSYMGPELKEKVQGLVNTVFTKSLDEGIKEAMKSNDPALIDAFHDVLVDELYNILLERKKVIQPE